MSMSTQYPSEPPPSYDSVTTGPSTGGAATNGGNNVQAGQSQHASSSNAPAPAAQGQQQQQQPKPHERDIEQEDRPLPPGWVPQYSEQHDRFFFVDTLAKPPRSIWIHPLDDQQWLSSVPPGMDPLAYVDKLWQDAPEPTPDPGPRILPSGGGGMPGVRQGAIHGMQGNYPGTATMQRGQQYRPMTLEDLTQLVLSKMGTPEEYEKKNPPSKASKMFHRKETARQRQRRHAEHKARDLADALAYRQPAYGPYGSAYGYPGYGRGYGQMYPGLGMSGAFLGLGAGALLGSAIF